MAQVEKAIGLAVSWSNLNQAVTATLTPGMYQVVIAQVDPNNPSGIIISDSSGTTSPLILGDGAVLYAVGWSVNHATLVTVTPQGGGAGISCITMTALTDGIGPFGGSEIF